MDKKKGIIIGVAGIAVLIIIFIFVLSDSSEEDKFIGAWLANERGRSSIFEFNSDGSFKQYSKGEDGDYTNSGPIGKELKWSLEQDGEVQNPNIDCCLV